VAAGDVQRVGRGLYRLPDAPVTEHQDLTTAARRVPEGVVCLMSALRFHGLTTQNPFEVWMAVGHKAWRPAPDHPPLRLVFLTGPALSAGAEEHDIGGVKVRVFSAAKTVADCFKFRNKIGIDVAVEALRDFRRMHPKRLQEVWKFAQVDRVARVIQPYLESVG
jgi:predicted transcriptional regulator of viral defense system